MKRFRDARQPSRTTSLLLVTCGRAYSWNERQRRVPSALRSRTLSAGATKGLKAVGWLRRPRPVNSNSASEWQGRLREAGSDPSDPAGFVGAGKPFWDPAVWHGTACPVGRGARPEPGPPRRARRGGPPAPPAPRPGQPAALGTGRAFQPSPAVPPGRRLARASRRSALRLPGSVAGRRAGWGRPRARRRASLNAEACAPNSS